MEIEIINTGRTLQRKYVILSNAKKELCRFDRLSDASLVFRFLNGSEMTEDEQKYAYSILADIEK